MDVLTHLAVLLTRCFRLENVLQEAASWRIKVGERGRADAAGSEQERGSYAPGERVLASRPHHPLQSEAGLLWFTKETRRDRERKEAVQFLKSRAEALRFPSVAESQHDSP